MLPPHLESFYLLICEKALQESDGVVSLIRLVDIFNIANVHADGTFAVRMSVATGGKFDKEVSKPDSALKIGIRHPDGREDILEGNLPPLRPPTERKYPNSPAGFAFVLDINLALTAFGVYYLKAIVDGQEVARTPFTLAPAPIAETGK